MILTAIPSFRAFSELPWMYSWSAWTENVEQIYIQNMKEILVYERITTVVFQFSRTSNLIIIVLLNLIRSVITIAYFNLMDKNYIKSKRKKYTRLQIKFNIAAARPVLVQFTHLGLSFEQNYFVL